MEKDEQRKAPLYIAKFVLVGGVGEFVIAEEGGFVVAEEEVLVAELEGHDVNVEE